MPPKRRTQEEETRKQEDRELARLESDLVRLTRSQRERETRREYWEGEVQRVGRMVVHNRTQKAQQATLVEEQREAMSRARRALEISEATARKVQRELVVRERRLKANEEALEQARVEAEVSTVVGQCF